MKRTIWITSEYFFPDVNFSTGYFMTGVASKLVGEFEIKVLSEVKSPSENKERKIDHMGMSITRFSGLTKNKDNPFKRLLNFFFISTRFFIHLVRYSKREDAILVVTNPATNILISSLIRKIKGCQIVIIVHDVFPENLSAVGLMLKTNPIFKITKKIFNWAYIQSDQILVCGRDMQEFFHSKLPTYKGQIKYIPNWGDAKKIKVSPKLRNEVITSLGIKDSFVFQFAGNLGRAQGIEFLLEAILETRGLDVVFVFFGGGFHVDRIKQQSGQSKNLFYGGIFKREEANKYINACDVAIVSLSPDMLGLGVPSKTYDILAAGKPILFVGDEHSEIGRLVNEHHIGYVCKDHNKVEIILGIQFFLNLSPTEFQAMSIRCRALLETHFSEEVVLDCYLQAVRELK
jgi:glycosyltransferase involved in cell wall biosynthesis